MTSRRRRRSPHSRQSGRPNPRRRRRRPLPSAAAETAVPAAADTPAFPAAAAAVSRAAAPVSAAAAPTSVPAPDATPPAWFPTYPYLAGVTHDAAVLHLALDEPARIHWAVVEVPAPPLAAIDPPDDRRTRRPASLFASAVQAGSILCDSGRSSSETRTTRAIGASASEAGVRRVRGGGGRRARERAQAAPDDAELVAAQPGSTHGRRVDCAGRGTAGITTRDWARDRT